MAWQLTAQGAQRRRPRRRGSALFALALLAGGACVDDRQAALHAADLAAAQNDAPREEALLRTVIARLGQQRARGDARASDRERALHARLAELYAGPLHAPQRAARALREALALGPGAEEAGAILMRLGDVQAHRLHERAQAAHSFEQAARVLGRRPAAATARLAAGEHHLVLGNASQATEAAHAVLRHPAGQNDAWRAHLLLGQARADAQDAAGAVEAYSALIALKPPAALAAVALARLADVHHQRGESAQALDYYHASLHAHPNAPMVQEAIARLRAQVAAYAPHRTILQGQRALHRVARR